MVPFKHAYMLLATDFELEPVIEQYLLTYPEAQPRQYDIVCKLQNERQEGDYCYLIVYVYVTGSFHPTLLDFIKSYCEVNNKVAKIEKGSNVFPDIAKANYGNPQKYGKR